MTGLFEHQAPDEATIAAYLSDRLDPSRAEAFEAYCLQHPEFAGRVELDVMLKTGLRQPKGTPSARLPFHRRRTLLAIAAGLVVAVACGLLLRPLERTGGLIAYRAVTEAPSSLLSGPRVRATLIRLREGSAVRRIEAPPGAGLLLIRVAPDAAPGRLGYRVKAAVEPQVIPRSVTLDELHPTADGYLELYLPVAAVAGQTLRITVDPSPAAGTDSLSFQLQVTYAPNTTGSTP